MTYVADLDPESPTRAAQEAHVAWADETMPGWEAREQAPEDRRLVAEQDDAEADEWHTRHYPWGWVLIPPRHDEFA